MTNSRNKQYDYLVYDFNTNIKPYLFKRFSNMDKELDWTVSHFCMEVMRLLEEYHILYIQYKARIGMLKELLKEFRKQDELLCN